MQNTQEFDVIVVGGGHAGLEAAHIAAKMGARVHLLTILVENIALASCNPAIGGLGKGHLVKEIDALGGVMGQITDACGIQYRTLNASKGPAVRGTRAQIDMDAYRIYARNLALNTPNLTISQEMVSEILVAPTEDLGAKTPPSSPTTPRFKAIGVRTNIGKSYHAHKVIITTGTFLRGLVHIGENRLENGRFGENASNDLSASLAALGLKLGRLKTGTCPRIDGRSIDFASLERHDGDENPPSFSYQSMLEPKSFAPVQLPCFVTYTNERTHELIRENFHRAPLFTGQISGVGPRYCPSIEDKINRFADKERHQLFLEPQTKDGVEYYINGLSTSLPFDVQEQVVASIAGLENAKITRYGYAIEYDYVLPTQLHHTLESKAVDSLYLAGQINGTTGYEEAGALGLMAGINATLSLQNLEPKRFRFSRKELVLRRDESYIGVMIDDLVTKGTEEPYRVFTSRAEYRLLLREDNAIYRLLTYAKELGTIEKSSLAIFTKDMSDIAYALDFLRTNSLTPNRQSLGFLSAQGLQPITQKTPLITIIGRDEFGDFAALERFLISLASKDSKALDSGMGSKAAFSKGSWALDSIPAFSTFSLQALEQIRIEAKYHDYIKKQQASIENMQAMLAVQIPQDFCYEGISGLSLEVIEKLSKTRPKSLFDASKISGITPASLDVLHLYIHLRSKSKNDRINPEC